VDDQTKQRARRREQREVVYCGDFDLLAEVHDIITPLARRVSAGPNPAAFRPGIDEMTAAVHALVTEVARLVALADARRAAAHLHIEHRGRAVKMLLDLAERPVRPEITDISHRRWATVLFDHVAPHSGPLADLLSRAVPPGTRRGLKSVSEYLVDALRVVDQAAINLEHSLSRAELRMNQTDTSITDPAEQVRAELAAMGVRTA
jgi:hypothetical protein